MTKSFQVEQKGKLTWRVVHQSPSDPQYKIGSRIPGLGKVVAVEPQGSTIQPKAKAVIEYGDTSPYSGLEIAFDVFFNQEVK